MAIQHKAPKASKTKISFLCQDCGHSSPKWEGRCAACGAWGTYVEFAEPTRAPRAVRPQGQALAPSLAPEPAPIGEQSAPADHRLSLGMPEIDRLLGGGVVAGSVLLLAGDPGIGKSTLLLQVAAGVARSGRTVLYVSGEESGAQVRLRAQRLGVESSGVLFVAETSVDAVLSVLERTQPGLLIVDSIQTLATDAAPSTAGSVAQVRECAQLLLGWAKSSDAPVFLAGHVTKDGGVAGPRVLEHMVDVVLAMEGEALSSYRVLRCTKNRFGSTNEVVLLEMASDGLAEVADPSAALIGERSGNVPGSAIVATIEGTRPLLCEVQALTSLTGFTPPRRTANGIDANRLVMLAAVLGRRAGLALAGQDIMVNVPGGLRIAEPAADLGIALAIASSFNDAPLDPTTVSIGEVGLNGEVRRVPQVERRLEEAARHGFTRALVPARNADAAGVPGIEVVGVESVRAAIAAAMMTARGVA